MNSVLLIGANGGIGRAVVAAFAEQDPNAAVYAVSRSELTFSQDNVSTYQLDTGSEAEIEQFCYQHKQAQFRYVINCTGVLHSAGFDTQAPEKRLEDLNEANLAQYFRINTILPALWLKHLVNCVSKEASTICCLSARVGSISDNHLGGWYGYRASKAALNMMMKTASIEYRRRMKRTAFICYHPGTVDSDLSKPFQANVQPHKLFTPEFTAQRLCEIVAQADVECGPYYLDWDGKAIDW